MTEADDDAFEGDETTDDIVRPIIVPELDDDGLIVQPPDDSWKQQRDEVAARARAVSHAHYADLETGPPNNTRTYDRQGRYNCSACNMFVDEEDLEDGESNCLLLDIDEVDPDAGSCGHWESECAGDPEMRLNVVPLEVAAYAIAANGIGFGCGRCEYASASIVGPDSRGRQLWCGVWACRVMPTGCCDNSEPEGGVLEISERGIALKKR